jgi:quercetin dioxygenase-like cupin family protein
MGPDDLQHYRWDDMPREPVTDVISRRYVTGQRTMVAQIFLDKGSIVPTHSHENEQISYLLSGALRFWIGADGSHELVQRGGDVLVIPPNLPHRAEALEDTLSLDIFTPPRQDWLEGTDTYFRRQE